MAAKSCSRWRLLPALAAWKAAMVSLACWGSAPAVMSCCSRALSCRWGRGGCCQIAVPGCAVRKILCSATTVPCSHLQTRAGLNTCVQVPQVCIFRCNVYLGGINTAQAQQLKGYS